MFQAVTFDPQLPLVLIAVLAALAVAALAFALWRGLTGWWLRALAALVLLTALARPSLRQEDRAPVSNIAIVVLDESASNRIDGRDAQLAEALEALQARLDRLGETGGLEVRTIRVRDAGEDGTALLTALSEAVAELPADRIAGAILMTDGQAHDPEALADFPAPVHVLLTGSEADWDRRVTVETAPAFAIVGEPVSLVLKVEDAGADPEPGGFASLAISLDGSEPLEFDVPVGESVTLPVTLQRGGMNVLQFSTPGVEGELTAQQCRRGVDQRRARPAAGAAGLGRAPSGRADLAQPAEIRQLGRSGAFHHPAPAGEAGLRAGLRAVADRLSDAGAVHGEGRRVRPDHLRPLQAARHPAAAVFREHRPLCARRRRAADRQRVGFRRGREPLPHAAGRGPAGPADGPGDRGGLPSRASRSSASAIRSRRGSRTHSPMPAARTASPAGAAGSAWSTWTCRSARW